MPASAVTEDDIISWVEKSLEDEHFITCKTTLTGKTEKGDGYASEIVFAEVNGTTQSNQDKNLDLVIKHGKSNELLRKDESFKKIFEREINFYENVLPAFKLFQEEKRITEGFKSVPKCYSTFILENMEVIILENLRKQGYSLHDRTKPFNLNHLKLILKEYGKLHALSFALRDQNNEEFLSISGCGRRPEEFFKNQNIRDTFHKSNVEASDMLRERGDDELHKKLENILEKDTIGQILDLMTQKEPQSVILHGDCWNNNFMFRYVDDDKTSPSEVKILDWQISALRSPAFDLSYLIYANSSHQQLERFEELLETYYTSFSNFLRQLGSNPEELFTYADLKRHWKKYSLFGALFMPTLLKFVLCKKEDAPALEDLKDGDDMGSFMSPNIGDADAYYERLKAVFTHYFEHSFK